MTTPESTSPKDILSPAWNEYKELMLESESVKLTANARLTPLNGRVSIKLVTDDLVLAMAIPGVPDSNEACNPVPYLNANPTAYTPVDGIL